MAGKGKKVHENFSPQDKETLLEYIKPEIKILESKKTDTYTNKKKQQLWQDILKKFNSRSQCKRSATQIKGIWKRMKIKAKKDNVAYRKSRKTTGGGEEPPQPDHISQTIAELLPGDFAHYENAYDDDAEEEDTEGNAGAPGGAAVDDDHI